MEFLEKKDFKHLVDFWLAVEAFKVVAMERCRMNSCESIRRKQVSSRVADKNSEQSQVTFVSKDVDFRSSNSGHQQGAFGASLKQPVLNCTGIYSDDGRHDKGLLSSVDGYQDRQSNGGHGTPQKNQKSRNTFERSSPRKEIPSGVNFIGNWVPFASDDMSLTENVRTPSENTGRKNSYVGKRIMSKQTRTRTKSKLFYVLSGPK